MYRFHIICSVCLLQRDDKLCEADWVYYEKTSVPFEGQVRSELPDATSSSMQQLSDPDGEWCI